MNTSEPILIADGIRGIHAPQRAARYIREGLKQATMDTSGIYYADIVNVADGRDEDGEAWADIVRNGKVLHIGNGGWMSIHEDSEGIFLVPEGYEFGQP